MINLKILIFLPILVFAADPDHLMLSRIVIAPDAAESISIINPTDEAINLSSYYICDDNEYYKMQTEGELSPSHFINGFTAQFPDINIQPNDTLLLVLNEDYVSYYANITPDLFLFESGNESMIETESGSFGISPGKLDDASESIILFKWDGNLENNIEDVDYFIWGGIQGAVDKTGIANYAEDTEAAEQLYFVQAPDDYYAFSRIEGLEEIDEDDSGGNGIIGEDGSRDNETSENFRQSWEIISIVEVGCTDLTAENYNPDAVIDDGSCEYSTSGTEVSIYDIIYNCSFDSDEIIDCADEYSLNNTEAADCPLYEETVTTTGILVDYFDVTPYGGPHSLTISDEDGNRIEVSIWPESNQYQDGFDITLTELNKLTTSPYGSYIIEVTGTVGVFCGDDIQLNIQTDWDVTVEYEYDIKIIEEIGGYFVEDNNINSTSIDPEPFVLIPSLGETLDFTYKHPANSRVIIRIFDLSGRLITSLIDRYIEDAGIWYNGVNPVDPNDQNTWINSDRSSWDGRDHLGQIVPPGTYLMHIEAYDFSTSKTSVDIAPVVVGVSQ